MARRSGPTLPNRVMLPDAAMLPSWHVRMAVGGVSKQVLGQWRKRYAFPHSYRDGTQFYTSVDALVTWLRERNCVVQIVTVTG
jgi:hypothetical protein